MLEEHVQKLSLCNLRVVNTGAQDAISVAEGWKVGEGFTKDDEAEEGGGGRGESAHEQTETDRSYKSPGSVQYKSEGSTSTPPADINTT